MSESLAVIPDDYEYLLSFLPDGWQDQAKVLGALVRRKKFSDAESLLRVLLIHLAEGCSLRETAVRAQRGGLAQVSDVAIMDRLKLAGSWFAWMNEELMKTWVCHQPSTAYGSQWRVCVVDGTRVKEPGPTGSSWCIHYAIGLPSLRCQQLEVCDTHGGGETFKRFKVQSGDLFIGDRVYGARPGIFHVADQGGDVLVRFPLTNLPMLDLRGRSFNLLAHLRSVQGTQVGDWPVVLVFRGRELQGRVCAIKKSRQATEKAVAQLRRKAQKNDSKTRPETIEAAGYIFIFTTIDKAGLTPQAILEMYRGRWQVELVFKRLKSIMGLGHLRKTDKKSAEAWLHGKLFVSMLIEALIRQGESFFPWGYPIREASGS